MRGPLTWCVVIGLCASTITALAADESTHEQVQVIAVKGENGTSLQTLAATPDNKIVALVGMPRYGVVANSGKSPVTEVRVFDSQGAELVRIPVPFSGQSIGVGPDGVIYVAGDGQLAKFTAEGKLLAKAELPHIAAVLKDQQQLREQAEAQLKAQVESIENTRKLFAEQAKALRDKGVDNLNAAEKQQLQSLEVNLKAYEQFSNSRQQQSIEAVMNSLTSRLRIVNSISATDKEVFIACGELKGYGYAVWRMDSEFKNPTQIMSALSGCCGQMDVQASGNSLYVAENTRHRVGQYDREGKQLMVFGKKDRESEGDKFGGCCNPMNCRIVSSGEIYTAESEGVVKKFNAKGEFVSLIGVAKLTGGCKNVAVAASPSGDKVYFCDLPGSRIIVLGQKPAANKTE